jgi:hypothetical protein
MPFGALDVLRLGVAVPWNGAAIPASLRLDLRAPSVPWW